MWQIEYICFLMSLALYQHDPECSVKRCLIFKRQKQPKKITRTVKNPSLHNGQIARADGDKDSLTSATATLFCFYQHGYTSSGEYCEETVENAT